VAVAPVRSAAAAGDDQIARLTAVIARQQRELDALRTRAAADAVVEFAKGVLVERLQCAPSAAAGHLARLAERSGVSLVDLAADVIGSAADTPGHPAAGRAAGADPLGGAPAVPRQRRAWLVEAAVARATDGTEVAAALLEEALAPLGAVAVAVWQLGPDGSLDLVGEAGLGALEASRWQHLPPQLDCLAQQVVRDGLARWQGRQPQPGPVGPGRWPGARAALPLTDSRGLLGVMEICWPRPREQFAAPLRQQLFALAEVCARTLPGQGGPAMAQWLPALLDAVAGSVLLAYAVRDGGGRVVDFRVDHVGDGFVDPAGRDPRDLRGRRLLDLYPLMTVHGDLFERAVEVLATGRPYRAEGVVARILVGDAAEAVELDVRVARLFDGVAISWRRADGPTGGDGLAALLAHAQRLGHFGGWQQNLRTAEVHWTGHTYALFQRPPTAAPVGLAELDAHVHPDDVAAVDRFRGTLLRLARPAAVAFRLVRADGSIRQLRAFAEPVTDQAGALLAVRGVYQDLSAQYRAQVVLAATQEELADSEQRAEDSHRLALALQRAIMPSPAEPVEATGLEVAVRYRPAEQEHLVGGDWYDAIVLPSREVLLVVGDIAGHGIKAVSGMVTLRNSLRGLAMTGVGPARLLHWLNSVAYHLTDNITGTVVCGLFDPVTRVLRWARAGHLPPVLVRDGAARSLPLPGGVLLGADPEPDYEEVATPLRAGDGLLLFTDGLIERRGTALDVALDALLDIAGRPATDVERHADRLLRHAAPDTDDDTCLIAVHVR
jgi:serine phosphatase RsbU (regulator of sigma subunit)